MTDRTAATRQPRRSIEVRRVEALDAALELILEHGYSGVTMEAVARRMGIAKPVVYKAYPDLSALLMALLDREEHRTFEQLAEALPSTSPGADVTRTLLAWVERLATLVHEEPATWRLMLLPPQGTPGAVRERVEAGRTVVRQQLRSMVERAVPDGRIDAALTSEALLAAAERLGTLMLDDPAAYPAERLVRFARAALGATLEPPRS
ncbi:TetR/AcrR family transcriptional regulator [Aeromicrobium marinum]|uniref:TetR/AcrR family transcriptional regulator n=1 Tax=Aeromicrobium marinum TaxID=219314 RepID=UPI00058DDE4B|nr:TetR/AcrR family transcriptional regulator [Aeromicrobium marinum]